MLNLPQLGDTMSESTPPQELYHPKTWPTWLAVGMLWVFIRAVPWRAQIRLGELIGSLLYRFAKERRHIALTNLRLCFPEQSEQEREQLAKAHFKAMSAALFETLLAWWAPQKQLEPLIHISGIEHLKAAQKKGRGVLLLSAHFSALELTGRMLASQQEFAVLYRRHSQPLTEYFFRENRKKRFSNAIRKELVRDVIRTLKEGSVVWYAPDQVEYSSQSVIVPFFGIPAATSTATARFAKITGASVVPFFGYRLPGNQGYQLEILPALENFPSDDAEADTTRINRVIEEAVRKKPEQYFWTHRRFRYASNSPHANLY